MAALRLIEPVLHPRVWGSRDLRAWYPDRAPEGEPIGEAWLSPPECPVLVKLLFPRERLSVQVHPDDAYAAAHGLGCGKSEAWYVVGAAPGAQVAAGLRTGVALRELEAACRAGGGAELLHWIGVRTGEVINVPAGTVHAIGGGSVLLEAQQPSDTTFRLHDYGRARALHLDAGFAAARESTACGKVAHGLAPGASGLLLTTPHFQLWRHCVAAGQDWSLPARGETRWLVSLRAGGAIPKGWLAEVPAGVSFSSDAAAELVEVRQGTS